MPLQFLPRKVPAKCRPPTFPTLPPILNDVFRGSIILVAPSVLLCMTIIACRLLPGRRPTLLVMKQRPGNRIRTRVALCRRRLAVHLIPLFSLVPPNIPSVLPILSLTVLTR